MHLVMWLAIYTGRREGELCEMRLDDFDKKIVSGRSETLKIQMVLKEIISLPI